MTRDAVIFLHVPKTAGSTLRSLMARQFAPSEVWSVPPSHGEPERRYIEYVAGRGPRPPTGSRADPNRRYFRMLAAMPDERVRGLRLLQGHFWFGLHEALPFPSGYVTMLRDPVARVLSMYTHRAAHHGLDTSLERYVLDGRDWEIDNGQARRLAGSLGPGGDDIRYAPVSDALAELARANLAKVAVVGTTERFDDFLVMLRATFGWRKLAYFPRNVSERRVRANQLDDTLVRAIRDRNEIDLELHRYAAQLVEERGADLRPPLESQVRRLRRRNTLYRRAHPAAMRVRKKALGARVKLGRLVGRDSPAG